MMKGVVDIEFIVAVSIFLSTIAFILLTVSARFPLLQERNELDNSIAESYAISDRLMHDRGDPGWEALILTEPENVKRIGLAAGQEFHISKTKADALDSFCNPAQGKAENLLMFYGMFSERKSVTMTIKDLSGLRLAECAGSTDTGAAEFTATRTAVMDDYPAPGQNSIIIISVGVSA